MWVLHIFLSHIPVYVMTLVQGDLENLIFQYFVDIILEIQKTLGIDHVSCDLANSCVRSGRGLYGPQDLLHGPLCSLFHSLFLAASPMSLAREALEKMMRMGSLTLFPAWRKCSLATVKCGLSCRRSGVPSDHRKVLFLFAESPQHKRTCVLSSASPTSTEGVLGSFFILLVPGL